MVEHLLLLCLVLWVPCVTSNEPNFKIPIQYTLFKQCNSTWGKDKMTSSLQFGTKPGRNGWSQFRRFHFTTSKTIVKRGHDQLTAVSATFSHVLNGGWNTEQGHFILASIIEKETICKVGCLLSSISMGLNYYRVQVNNEDVNPGTLNLWLRQNGGYTPNDDLKENTLEKLPRVNYKGSFKNITHQDIIQNLQSGVITIAHVRNGTHFVLLTGYTLPSSNIWAVNDSGFNETSYSTSDIVGFRVFSMQQ